MRARCSFEKATDSTKMSSADAPVSAITRGSMASTSSIQASASKPGGTLWASRAVEVVCCATCSPSRSARRSARSSASTPSP